MIRLTRKALADYIYCLNWHCKDLHEQARDTRLTEKERLEATFRCRELYELKSRTLLKMVSQGQASFRPGKHRIAQKNYYCIRLDRENSFHIHKDMLNIEMENCHE